MAGAMPEAGGLGRRSLNADVNLVPFIDLLSVCICFLLMTAVWVQLGTIDVKQAYGTGGPSDPGLELEVKFVSAKQAVLTLKRGGKVERKIDVAAADDAHLPERVREEVRASAAAIGSPSAALIQAHRGVSHGQLVGVMDVLRKEKITSLGVTPAPES